MNESSRTALVRAEKEDAWTRIKSLVLDSVTSPHSKRAYEQALDAFERWCAETGASGFTKATVQAYRSALEASGLAASSINVRLSAIRKLAAEAADNGLLAPEVAAAVSRVKGAKRHGVRAGNWLTLDQTERLLDLPTRKPPRASAIARCSPSWSAAVCAGRNWPGSGSRTSSSATAAGASWTWPGRETASARFRCQAWAKAAVDDWLAVAGFAEGLVLGAVNKGDRITGQGMSAQSIYEVVEAYGNELGRASLAPHDVRRTFAKLAHKGRAPLEQIQIALGHASIQTTERYLGVEQNLNDAPCDHLGIRVQVINDHG